MLAGIGWKTIQAHWHGHEVCELPPGARLLASSEKCRHQAWAVGISTYGIQYHPEIHMRRLGEWADDEPDDLGAVGLTREALDRSTAEHFSAAARLADRLFGAVALLLMPADRRYAGVGRD